MKKTKLYIFASIVGLIACMIVALGPAFLKGARQSDACTTTNTDHWLCRIAGNEP